MGVSFRRSGWRWVVLAASFLSTVANSTIFYAFGALVLPWMDEFAASAASITAVASCGSSISAMACPIASYFVQRWGYRTAHATGGALLVTSFVTSSFAQSLGQMFFTYSVLGGFGSSLCMVSYINAISDHFRKNKALAFAIVTSAYGIGGFIFPLYFEALVDIYTWRGAMLITSAVFGNVIACGLILHPVSSSPRLPGACFQVKRRLKGKEMVPSSSEVTSYISESFSASNSESDAELSFHLSAEDISGRSDNSENALCVKMFSLCSRERVEVDENCNITSSQAAYKKGKEVEVDPPKRNFFQISKVLLTSWPFYIVLIHNVTTYMGFFTIFALTPIRASYDIHLTKQQAFVLVSTIGIPQCVFRIVFGAIVAFKWVKASTMYLGAFFLAGVLTVFSPLAKTFTLQIIYCLSSSTCFASVAFYNVLVFELYEKDFFNVSYGYLEAMHGIGIISGPLIGGIIFDITGSCTFSFIFAGFAILFGVLTLPVGLTLTGKISKLNF